MRDRQYQPDEELIRDGLSLAIHWMRQMQGRFADEDAEVLVEYVRDLDVVEEAYKRALSRRDKPTMKAAT